MYGASVGNKRAGNKHSRNKHAGNKRTSLKEIIFQGTLSYETNVHSGAGNKRRGNKFERNYCAGNTEIRNKRSEWCREQAYREQV